MNSGILIVRTKYSSGTSGSQNKTQKHITSEMMKYKSTYNNLTLLRSLYSTLRGLNQNSYKTTKKGNLFFVLVLGDLVGAESTRPD